MENLLTAAQVAIHLKMHPKTLYKMLRENRIALSFVRRKRSIFFRESAVKAYVEMNEVRRDGTGKSKPAKKRPIPRGVIAGADDIGKYDTSMFRILTDEEAQAFFAKCERDEDGSFISNP
jgi:excisionase family DNA binding protein